MSTAITKCGFKSCPFSTALPFKLPPRIRIISRCTIHISDPSQNHRLASIVPYYDLLALRPTTEKALQQACQSLSPDLISLDLSQRFPFHFKHKTLLPAVSRGVKFEICYSAGTGGNISGVEAGIARRNLISNATSLIRATRGRGLVISSEASRALACRGPADVINLAVCWGLGSEKGREGIGAEARGCVVQAEMRRRSFRGVVDVIYAGEKLIEEDGRKQGTGSVPPALKTIAQSDREAVNGKRKAEGNLESTDEAKDTAEKPVSKRELKRRAKKARSDLVVQQASIGHPMPKPEVEDAAALRAASLDSTHPSLEAP